jgi:hypothetical protein
MPDGVAIDYTERLKTRHRSSRHLPQRLDLLVSSRDLTAWMSDYTMPERTVAPDSIMDPEAAAKFFD